MEDEIFDRLILSVHDTIDGSYKVSAGEGTSLSEIAFAISIIIKVLDRDELIEKNEMLKLIKKYLNDTQYEEVKS